MKVAEFDTRLTPSAESLQFITTCSPLSNLDSDSDMDAEGDPDPECVKVPMVVGDETAATSCCVYPPNIDAEGDPDPQYFTNVPMVHDKVATTTSLGIDLPENLTFDSDVEEAPLSMDVDEETTELSEPMMVTGNNLNEGSSSIGLNQNSTLISHLEMNVPSKLRTQILEYWSHHLRSRKHTIKAEKLWAKKYSAVVLGNCANCKPGKACILETGRAKCTNCIKKKQLCSHMSTFKIEWIAGQLGTTLSAVQVVVDSVVNMCSPLNARFWLQLLVIRDYLRSNDLCLPRNLKKKQPPLPPNDDLHIPRNLKKQPPLPPNDD
ncbi:hypothetical protein L218DRAFT_400310 [Marasmius fiardii PR-910]|nr:hypothetical protein L218DRAFT_400310 [Marasmius fiardii PR-910]